MFLFNSLHQGNRKVSGSTASKLRRHWMRSVFALFVMLCLSTAFLFTGCDNDSTPENVTEYVYVTPVTVPDSLVGKWEDTTQGDFYLITSTSILYDSGYGIVGGTIRDYKAFDEESGVIIFEYDKGLESSYAEENGNFTALYYVELSLTDTIQFKGGTAWDASNADYDSGNYGDPAEQKTLEAAKAAFTSANKDRYLSWAGGPYVKQ